MPKVELMNLNTVCRSFPDAPEEEVSRAHLLDTIEKTLEGDTQVLVIEGAEGIGKTTLLAQFARRHCNNALSLFIKPASRLAYAPDYLRLILSEQLHWALNSDVLEDCSNGEAYWTTAWPRLQRRALKSRQTFYFVVDGLEDLPSQNARTHEILLQEILPLGLSGFRFLFSGDSNRLLSVAPRSVQYKPFLLTAFSLDETGHYLAGLRLDRQSIEEVHKLCGRGIPGQLASVRRMVQSGTSIDSILKDPGNLPDFVAMEWRTILASATKDHKRLLAAVAFGRRPYSIDDLVRVLAMAKADAEGFLNGTTVIAIAPHTNEVSYISEAQRVRWRRVPNHIRGGRGYLRYAGANADGHDYLRCDLIARWQPSQRVQQA
jgi:hypothetical protein